MEKKGDAVPWHLPPLECLPRLSSREVAATPGGGDRREQRPQMPNKRKS